MAPPELAAHSTVQKEFATANQSIQIKELC